MLFAKQITILASIFSTIIHRSKSLAVIGFTRVHSDVSVSFATLPSNSISMIDSLLLSFENAAFNFFPPYVSSVFFRFSRI